MFLWEAIWYTITISNYWETRMDQTIDQKVVNNAISAYFWLWTIMLFNRDNPLIHNDFVRGHSKTAALLHLWVIFIFIFFDIFSFLWNHSIFWVSIQHILITISLLAIFAGLAFWAKKAYSREEFSIMDFRILTKTENILKVNKNTVHREQDKTSIILSYIPFAWYLLYPKFAKYATIRSVNKINLYSSLIILLFFTSGREDTAWLLLLLYIIFVVFSAFKLYIQDEISVLNLENVWSFEELYIRLKAFILYIYNYSKRDHRYREYELYLKIEKAAVVKQNKLMLKSLLPKKSLPFPKWILYVPFINLVWLFFLDSKYKTHIINGMCVNVLLIVIWLITWFNSAYSVFILFPIFYGIAYHRKIDYRFPAIYDIAKVEMLAWWKAKQAAKRINELRKEEKEVVLTVKDSQKQ